MTDDPHLVDPDYDKHGGFPAFEAADPGPGFGRFLDEELLPRGRDKEAAGREQYERDSRYFLGAEIDLDET